MPNLEDQAYWQRNFERNEAWLRPGEHNYNTSLDSSQEGAFRQWLKANKVPFNPNLSYSDYDMRGFWKAMRAGDPIAKSAVDQNDKLLHYPDYWKTPYSATFSNESQWADPKTAPRWQGDLYQLPNGTVLWNDKTQQWIGPQAPWQPSDAELLKGMMVPP